jgi:tetratricopeptide (TPR) repeat protein
MNTIFRSTIVLALIALVGATVAAQNTVFETESDHYRVLSEISEEHSEDVAERMEAMLALYNEQFRFPVDELEVPLRVRIFATKARFDRYLRRLIDESRNGYVYLHYNDLAKSELVGYHTERDDLQRSMIHQSFVQYFRAFIPNPPLWIREGFAVYYEASEYDEDFGAAIYRENLAWLETLKDLVAGVGGRPIPVDRMLALTLDEARSEIDVFYPQAWGMVSFLLNDDDPAINRILWDSLSALQPDATLAENAELVYREAFRWADEERLVEDFLAFLSEQRSFRGWVEYGVESYNNGDVDESERAFVQALKLNDENYVPYYYLGLLNYERQNYGLADFYYQSALEYGADEPITLYALGVNAYADNRFDEAISYLELTVDRDPAYRDKAEDLLIRIQG